MIEPCPQCGFPDMSIAHAALCLQCGVPVHAASPDPTDHLCEPHQVQERLVQHMLQVPLNLYDRAVMAMPGEAIGLGAGNPVMARSYLHQALAQMEAFSSPDLKAHPTYLYWHGEITRMLEHLPLEAGEV